MGDPDANRDVLGRAFAASEADYAVLESDRPTLAETIEDVGYTVVGETWVREMTGVPLALVETVEDRLGGVEDGVRFGERAAAYEGDASDDDLEVVPLPADLLTEAQGIDQTATREAVERATVAFETTEGGNRVAGRAVIAADHDAETLVDELVGVLKRGYDAVEREDDTVVARETAFDPDRARTLGVTEGPQLGKLAEGEPVTVGGDEIDPSVVHVEREHRFSVDKLLEWCTSTAR